MSLDVLRCLQMIADFLGFSLDVLRTFSGCSRDFSLCFSRYSQDGLMGQLGLLGLVALVGLVGGSHWPGWYRGTGGSHGSHGPRVLLV